MIKKRQDLRLMDRIPMTRCSLLTVSGPRRIPVPMETANGKFIFRDIICALASLLVLAHTTYSQAENVQIVVEDSGSKEVDVLVSQLVSHRPAPFPSGYSGVVPNIPFVTPQVSKAITQLKAKGPRIFPALVKHLSDDRYSYSDISTVWDNHTVGDAVREVLSDGHYMYSGYKARETPSGFVAYLSFDEFLQDKRPEKWAAWAKDKSRLEIQMDFIDWCIAKEKTRGFIDIDQEKTLLTRYEKAREQVRAEYSKRQGAVNGTQPIRSVTNSSPSMAGSRR